MCEAQGRGGDQGCVRLKGEGGDQMCVRLKGEGGGGGGGGGGPGVNVTVLYIVIRTCTTHTHVHVVFGCEIFLPHTSRHVPPSLGLCVWVTGHQQDISDI